MKLKEVIKYEREHFPPYYLKYNRAVLIPFAVLFIVGPLIVLAVAIPLGIKFEESIITYIPVIVWGAALAVYTVLLAVIGSRVKKRLINDRAAELEEKFKDMPQEDAAAILKQNKVIDDSGFILEGDVFGEKVVPFSKAQVAFGLGAFSTVINMQIAVADEDGGDMKIYDLDGALYNFLVKGDFGMDENKAFALLISDKKAFAELLLKGNSNKNLNKLMRN